MEINIMTEDEVIIKMIYKMIIFQVIKLKNLICCYSDYATKDESSDIREEFIENNRGGINEM